MLFQVLEPPKTRLMDDEAFVLLIVKQEFLMKKLTILATVLLFSLSGVASASEEGQESRGFFGGLYDYVSFVASNMKNTVVNGIQAEMQKQMEEKERGSRLYSGSGDGSDDTMPEFGENFSGSADFDCGPLESQIDMPMGDFGGFGADSLDEL
jgi:hypothetical protein